MWKNRRWWIVGGLLLLGVAALVLGRRAPPPPEEQIRQMLWRGKTGLEKQSLRQVMSVVSRDYADGSLQYREVFRALLHAFQEVDSISISLSQPTIQVDPGGRMAQVHFDRVEIMATSHGSPRHYATPVDLNLRRERSGWKVVRMTGWVDITQ